MTDISKNPTTRTDTETSARGAKRTPKPLKATTKIKGLVVAVVVTALMATSAGSAMGQTAPAKPEDRAVAPHENDDTPNPYKPHIRIGVPGMADDGIVELRDGAMAVEVVNQRDEAVNFDLAVDVQADGVNSRVAQRDQALAASGTSQFRVSLDSLGITPERLRGPAVLTLRATTHDAAGNQIDGVVNPSLYLSQDPDGGVVLYDEERLLRNYKGGTISGVESPRPSPGTINLFAGTASGVFDPQADLPIAQPGLHTVCVNWQYAGGDHNSGERYYTHGEPMAARGVKLTVTQGGVSKTVYADKNTGCTSLPLAGGKLAKVVVFAEAKIGTNDNITVRAFEQPEDVKATAVPHTPQNVKKWSYYLLPGAGTSHLNIPAGTSSTLMAYGSFSARRLDQEAPLAQPNLILNLDYEPNKTNSDAGGETVNISKYQYDRKFVYGHEVGHWYAGKNGLGYSTNYDTSSIVPACTSAHSPDELWHVMRSTEVSSAAFSEGLAHYFSTVVWNGLGWQTPMFRYYKDLFTRDENKKAKYGEDLAKAYADYEVNDNRIDMVAHSASPLGGVRGWRAQKCPDETAAKYSVELDWARFLVNYLEGNRWWGDWAGEQPTFGQLLDLLRYAQEHFISPARQQNETQASYDLYSHLLGAVKDPGLGQTQFVGRFVAYAQMYGVTLDD